MEPYRVFLNNLFKKNVYQKFKFFSKEMKVALKCRSYYHEIGQLDRVREIDSILQKWQ
jgi:hypothetical protein